MTVENIILDNRAGALAQYPHAKRVGDFIFVSGVSSRRPDNTHEGATPREDGAVDLDVGVQTKAVIKNIQIILQAAGADLTDIIDMTTFLVKMSDFKEYNNVYNEYFRAAEGPSRTTVAVSELTHPNLLIEMKAIAYTPQN